MGVMTSYELKPMLNVQIEQYVIQISKHLYWHVNKLKSFFIISGARLSPNTICSAQLSCKTFRKRKWFSSSLP